MIVLFIRYNFYTKKPRDGVTTITTTRTTLCKEVNNMNEFAHFTFKILNAY